MDCKSKIALMRNRVAVLKARGVHNYPIVKKLERKILKMEREIG